MPQRIPSPRELQVHTQSIMQNALIKKKLEEQRENFRKRQELQQQQQHQRPQSQSQAQNNLDGKIKIRDNMLITINNLFYKLKTGESKRHIASPIPALAFTPTSVLRKMTAEKDTDNAQTNSNLVNVKDKVGKELSSNKILKQHRFYPFFFFFSSKYKISCKIRHIQILFNN